MDEFRYQKGALHAEQVSIEALADAVGTPFYCYSAATLRHHYHILDTALAENGLSDRLICYSVKANSNLAVIATLAQMGAGADIVSQGELHRALQAGVPPEKIVFSGVGKTAEEMRAALKAGILQFNVESLSEIDLLAETAHAMGKTAEIALRVNPDIEAGTHKKYPPARRRPNSALRGKRLKPVLPMRALWTGLRQSALIYILAVKSLI